MCKDSQKNEISLQGNWYEAECHKNHIGGKSIFECWYVVMGILFVVSDLFHIMFSCLSEVFVLSAEIVCNYALLIMLVVFIVSIINVELDNYSTE